MKKETKWVGDDKVQTNGAVWQIRQSTTHYIHATLKEHIREMQEYLTKYPDAEVELGRDDPYSDTTSFILKWWQEVPDTHKEVKKYLERQEANKRWAKYTMMVGPERVQEVTEFIEQHPQWGATQ